MMMSNVYMYICIYIYIYIYICIHRYICMYVIVYSVVKYNIVYGIFVSHIGIIAIICPWCRIRLYQIRYTVRYIDIQSYVHIHAFYLLSRLYRLASEGNVHLLLTALLRLLLKSQLSQLLPQKLSMCSRNSDCCLKTLFPVVVRIIKELCAPIGVHIIPKPKSKRKV